MLIVELTPEGDAIGDTISQAFAESIVHAYHLGLEREKLVQISTSLTIEHFRICVKRGMIAPQEFRFKFKDELLEINADGRLPRWPTGFCDELSNALRELAGA